VADRIGGQGCAVADGGGGVGRGSDDHRGGGRNAKQLKIINAEIIAVTAHLGEADLDVCMIVRLSQSNHFEFFGKRSDCHPRAD